MSIIGEHRATTTAAQLEKIILTAMNNKRWDNVRSTVRGFVKEELVEWYYDQCIDSYGMHNPNEEIVEMFPPKNKISDVKS